MRYYVTGGMGFFGAHLIKTIGDQNVITVSRDKVSNGTSVKLKINPSIIYGDLCDFKICQRSISDYDVDYIIHAAASAIVSSARKSPSLVFNNNIVTTINIMEAARLHDLPVAYWSTDKVYSSKPNPNENDDTVIGGAYETSKAISEEISKSYSSTYGLKLLICRSANLYGAFDYNPRIVPRTITNCQLNQSPIIYNNHNPLREYIYVQDAIDALLLLIKRKCTGIYNIGSGDTRTQEQVVMEILQHFPNIKPSYIKADENTIKEIGNQCLDSSKIRNETGWFNKFTFEQGIAETIKQSLNT